MLADTVRAHSRSAAPRLSSRPVPAPKTASGGLRPRPYHRLSRWHPQPVIASGKSAPNYDLARRGAVLPQKEEPRKLPPCMQNFLRGRIDSDPGAIRFYDGGSVFNLFDNSVTYGNDIYLTHERFPVGASAWNKFHEIWHTSQNAKFGFNSFDHAGAYLMFGGHDASPLEQAADDFATNTLRAYRDAGLDKTCRF